MGWMEAAPTDQIGMSVRRAGIYRGKGVRVALAWGFSHVLAAHGKWRVKFPRAHARGRVEGRIADAK